MSAPTPPPSPFAPPSRPPVPPTTSIAGGPPSSGASRLTPAGRAGQVIAFLVCALAAGLLAAWLDMPEVFVGAVVALGAGVAVGSGTGIGLRFTNIAGWVVACLATLGTVMVLALASTYLHVRVPYAVAPLIGLFVAGLDWTYVQRLRGAVVLSGVLVVPLLAADKGWETAAALVWFGSALVAFWFLERDGRASVPPPEPVAGGEPPRRSTSVVDLLGVIGPALLIGFVAALLIGNPSCSSHSSPPRTSGSGAVPRFGAEGGTGSQGQGGSSGRAGSPSSGGSGGSDGSDGTGAPLYRLDRNGREQQVGGSGFGGGTITDSSGRQLYVTSEGGQTVVRDGDGNVVARLDRDEVVAGSPGGSTQHFQIDEQGRVFVLGTDGTRYDLEERGGQVVLVDPDGQVVASGPLDADHLYVRDADGDVLIPGHGGDGEVPIPDQAVREGLLGQGKTYSTTDGSAPGGAGNPMVTGPDGSTRIYSTDAEGRPQVRVDDGHGQVRTYVYDQSGDQLEVLELDQDGNQVNRYLVDPHGSFVEGRTASGGDASGSGSVEATPDSATGRAGAPTEVTHHRGTNWWLVALLALIVALAVGGVAWWLTRSKAQTDQSWAEALVRRIDREGAARGRPRGTDETVPAFTTTLAAAQLPDPRLTTVGRVASDALYGRHEPSADLRAWADATVTEIVEAHPVPRWTDRFRRGAARSAAT